MLKTFDDVLVIKNGRNQKAVENPAGKYPIYGSGGVIGHANQYICDANTVVIGRKGSINSPIFVEEPFWNVDTAFGLAACESVLLPKYLYYFCSQFDFERLNKTVTIPSLTKSDLLKIQIEVPALSDQRIAVSKLEGVETIINLRKQQLEKLDLLVKARFVEMFGDVETNPKGWKKEPLKQHIEMLTGFPFDSSGYCESGVKICGGLIILPDKIKWEDCKYWSSVDGYEQYQLAANDIVVALDRPWISDGFKIGMISADDLPALLIQRTARIRGTDMPQAFIMHLLKDNSFEQQCTVTGSLVPHISNKDINNFNAIVPPIELQEQFAAFVSQVDKSKSAIQRSLDQLETLQKALMQKYFG